MNQAGIDMIHATVGSDQYRIHDVSAFNHNRGNLPYGTEPEPWGMSVNLQPLTGRLNLNRGAGGMIATVDLNKYGLHIQMNPSKMLHDYELTSDVSAQVEKVKKMLSGLTIDVDLNTARINRIDLTRQSCMDQPIQSFNGAFSALMGRRVKQRVQYPDGFEIGNKSKLAVFYDKTAELKINGIIGPPNLLRAEARFNGKAVGNTRSGVGLTTVNDLLTIDPEYLTDRYRKFMMSDVFRCNDGLQLTIDYGTEVHILRALIDHHKTVSKALDVYIASSGLDHLISSFGSIDHFRTVLRNMDVKQATAYRQADRLNGIMQQSRFIDAQRKKKDSIAHSLDTLIKTFAA